MGTHGKTSQEIGMKYRIFFYASWDAGLLWGPILADASVDFYKGKTVTIISGTTPKGSQDDSRSHGDNSLKKIYA